MPRIKGTRGPCIKKETSEAAPSGHVPNEGLVEELLFSDYPDSFFTEGMVKSLAGNSNILIVAPNLSPDTDDRNIGLVTCLLAEALGGYAVVNCRCYRRPVAGDPTPEELQSPRS